MPECAAGERRTAPFEFEDFDVVGREAVEREAVEREVVGPDAVERDLVEDDDCPADDEADAAMDIACAAAIAPGEATDCTAQRVSARLATGRALCAAAGSELTDRRTVGEAPWRDDASSEERVAPGSDTDPLLARADRDALLA
jgi:hypothetical protein